MDIIEIWKPEYIIGIEEIDRQHKYLFELFILLDNIRTQPDNQLSLQQALISLQDYVEIHFSSEEKYLRHHPDFEAHRRLHESFIEKAGEFSASFEAGTLDLEQVVEYLNKWLRDHILGVDIPYFKELKKTFDGPLRS
ncbi:bacteriohemerythrin [Desulfolithobacter sp.]